MRLVDISIEKAKNVLEILKKKNTNTNIQKKKKNDSIVQKIRCNSTLTSLNLKFKCSAFAR